MFSSIFHPKLRLLYLDEVSMADEEYLEILDKLARHYTGVDKPFGGIVLCMCGDFLQLPGIPREANQATKDPYPEPSSSS